ELNFFEARNVCGTESTKCQQSPIAERKPQRTSDETEQHAFCKALANQPGASGSKRFPYSDLSVTAHRLRKRQVANVRAGDEQNEPHSRKHDQKCLAGRNCNSAKHRDDHRSLFRVVSWIFLLQGECD